MSEEHSPAKVLREALSEVGASDALAVALGAAGLSEPPERLDAFVEFLRDHLEEALVGFVHPATASHLVETVHERVAGVDESRTRIKTDRPQDGEAAEDLAVTVPPPPSETAESYEDLASGAVHDRKTPVWGLRVAATRGEGAESVWVIVSHSGELVEATQSGAPGDVDVLHASSVAVLKGALSRGGEHTAVVIDAGAPSIPTDKAIAAVIAEESGARVILWRMDVEERERLHEAHPSTRTWLPCDEEVTPEEIVRLLGI